MAAPTWARERLDGTSYLFFLAANPKLKLVGWVTALAQFLSLLTITTVLEEDELSHACENSAAFKCSTTAAIVCLILFVAFMGGWLTLKASRAILAVRKGALSLGITLGIVVCTSYVCTSWYAFTEAASSGAQKLILESVSVLLILDLDDKVYEAATVILGAEQLDSWLGFDKVEPFDVAKADGHGGVSKAEP